uniref:Spectrin repeat containing, nuclear envelope 2b n=1 Tax=Maylandia zebra TaxID=106582 RepID=A0A3P9AVY9_9CICH
RVRKLKETLVTVQQLDKNMSNLRTWLSRIETELAKPVVYSTCHSDEIQRKLAEQQDLQRDIEQHTESVASVLTLCDVLLHDADACGSDSENDSIQQTTLSLDRRWRNICAMSMERRMIEETWRLWCKFLDDYSRFEHWLKTAELTAASPDSADVLYTSAKEELKKFEAFQRQVHERLTQLELVNKQYRRLARENRTDAASKLKVMVHEGNQRWDSLQRRVAAVLRRLKYFTSQREDFEGTREGILVWLTEMDLQLTNVEHFSESDIEEKMRELNLQGFQQEITLNTNKIDALIVFGENLIQKSAPLDAVLIEDELEELHSYCQEVFGRVARFHHRLVNRRPVLEEEEREMSDRDTDRDDSPDLTPSWMAERRRKEVMCHLLVPPIERSGRETPLSVDSIPLEWDHTVDVGGSSSHEDDEDATFFSALSGVIERWELLQAHKNAADIKQDLEQWQKLNSDLSDVTSWLGRVLPELERLKRIEMQKIFNSYKCLMISINLSSRHFLRGDSTELHEQQEALDSANHSWTQACSGLESWERSLHSAVMQCQELRGRQRRVSSLQAISSQLLLEATGEDSVEAKEKVHVISNKLHLLLRQVAADLRPLFYRVLRAAFPLHLLFFMLLVLACLVPLSEENYSCTLTNNFARSFYPMLHYTNGPPPT